MIGVLTASSPGADATPASSRERVLPRRGEIVLPCPRMRVRLRGLFVGVALVFALAAALVWALLFGDIQLTPGQVIAAVAGAGDELTRTIVVQWRLGRALVAAAVGAALGLSGALTQTIARNPLASPDILGISMGASAAAVVAIVFGGNALTIAGVTVGVPLAAVCGGLLTALAIVMLSRGAGPSTYRIVLVGLGINALLGAVISYTLLAGDLDRVEMATMWLTGAITTQGYTELALLGIAFVPAALVVLMLGRHLGPLSLGEDLARAVGVPLYATIALLIAAVCATSAAVAITGPIGFVAFVAGQLARVMCGSPTPPLLASTLVGAVLVVVADIATSRLLPWTLPTGIATSLIGVPVFIVLLVSTSRKVTTP